MNHTSQLEQEIINIYRKRAENYDVTANLYYLIGYPEWTYRRIAVNALHLKRGDRVVEIGCGTGLNFGLIEDKIGPEGELIGVDLTDAMLEQAKARVTKNNWQNVQLINQDAVAYQFPEDINGIISTFALSLVPQAPDVIQRSSRALTPEGYWSLVDLQIPHRWPRWLVRAAMTIIAPFGPTEGWQNRKPWRSIQQMMRSSLTGINYEERFFGTTYLMSGVRTSISADGVIR